MLNTARAVEISLHTEYMITTICASGVDHCLSRGSGKKQDHNTETEKKINIRFNEQHYRYVWQVSGQ